MIKLEKLASKYLNKGFLKSQELEFLINEKTTYYFYKIYTGEFKYKGKEKEKILILSSFINWDEGMIIFNKDTKEFFMMAEDYDFEMHKLEEDYFKEIIRDVKEGWYNFLWEEE